jgi:hypothetical protein
MYLDGLDPNFCSRLERNIFYVKFYRNLKEHLGFQEFVFCDNGSTEKSINEFNYAVGGTDVSIFQRSPHLPRGEGYDYPYCWRGLDNIRHLIEGNLFTKSYDKVITIDTDGFVVSGRMANYIKGCNTGWVSFWCPRWAFPDASIHILNKDAFPHFLDFIGDDAMKYNGKCMETTLTFTHVEKYLKTDRYGETRVPQYPWLDFYGNSPLDISRTLEFRP